ncbi:MAG: NAD(P)/FAD-dependent oxidoreductase [candidate division Zixibacteria bacterium]|nr:NAD(P)/FAD-dependent oxidoreductase [candidate division Zixibacteria bacterium]
MTGTKIEDAVIIGAGPAGIAAAIQLKRHGITPVIFESNQIGGLLYNANLVENYPGFPDGISGPELVELLSRHLQKASIMIQNDEVTGLDYDDGKFKLSASDKTWYAQSVVIASGTMPKLFDDIAIPKPAENRIFYEVYPLLKEQGKTIIIVGAGDAAFDYALNLSEHNDVIILNRGEEIRCLPLLKDRADKTESISYRDHTQITGISIGQANKLQIECQTIKDNLRLDSDFIIFAIGRQPQLGYVSEKLIAGSLELMKQGIFHIIGDVKNGIYRQSAIAIGQGIMAAMMISRNLKDQNR